jgi:hypothetical protein
MHGWLRGNTHTHTLWSDGDTAPEMVADWYQEHGYDFLVLSDHNVLLRDEMWVQIGEGLLTERRLTELIDRFGVDKIDIRSNGLNREMRLQTLEELRARFDMLLIEGEEVSDGLGGVPIHVNVLNVEEVILPQRGGSVREALNNNIAAVVAQASRLERPMLTHINHPNTDWAKSMSWEDFAHVEGVRFFEVYNGHNGKIDHGDAEHPSTEEMWDRANALRLTELDLPLLYGLATDDAHRFSPWGAGHPNPGRGWVMVRGSEAEPDAIITAMQAGEFYASSGVLIRDIRTDAGRYTVEIVAEDGVEYVTRFMGSRLDGTRNTGSGSESLAQTSTNPASYVYEGDELFVRAVVESSRPHPNPHFEGDRERAWLQPVVPGTRGPTFLDSQSN